jgi:hypothetical protein
MSFRQEDPGIPAGVVRTTLINGGQMTAGANQRRPIVFLLFPCKTRFFKATKKTH